MDSKTKNFFKAISEISLFNMELHPQMLTDALQQAVAFDFDIAVSLWEFYLEKYESLFFKIPKANESLSVDVLKVFYAKSEQKTLKTLADNLVLKKYLFASSDVAFDSTVQNSICQNIVSGKTESADDFLKAQVKHNDFGKILLQILDLVRQKLLTKKQHGDVRLTPKQANYLTAYAAKVKTAEKAVLLQRIKEMS